MGNYDEPIEAVIFDIDGTLANVDHRRHFVEGKKKDFEAFYNAMDKDSVNSPVCGLINMYYLNDWHVIICTGRPEEYREITVKWLKDKGIFYRELHMRQNEKKYEPDFKVKQEMLNEITKHRKVHVTVDDRKQVVDMWRKNGIMCFQVDEGNF